MEQPLLSELPQDTESNPNKLPLADPVENDTIKDAREGIITMAKMSILVYLTNALIEFIPEYASMAIIFNAELYSIIIGLQYREKTHTIELYDLMLVKSFLSVCLMIHEPFIPGTLTWSLPLALAGMLCSVEVFAPGLCVREDYCFVGFSKSEHAMLALCSLAFQLLTVVLFVIYTDKCSTMTMCAPPSDQITSAIILWSVLSILITTASLVNLTFCKHRVTKTGEQS